MIRQARIDPSMFLRYLLMARVHRELQNPLSTNRQALVELPRDHGKTTQVCRRVLWELGASLRIKIVCASEADHRLPKWLRWRTNFRSCHRSVKQYTGQAGPFAALTTGHQSLTTAPTVHFLTAATTAIDPVSVMNSV
jgi:hypothetical protein